MGDFTPRAVKSTVGREALEALDIRVGTIERVEDVPRSPKLMKLIVDFGDHTRTILAGIKKERENPREIEGRQALFVVNLEARKMAGEVSQGMLLDIGYADGVTPVLAVPERTVPNGTYRIELSVLKALGDPRAVVSDPEARYFGGRVEERSLVPLGEARLGRIGFDDWFRSSRARV